MEECLRVWASFVFALMGLWLAFQAASWGRGGGRWGGPAAPLHSLLLLGEVCREGSSSAPPAAAATALQHHPLVLWCFSLSCIRRGPHSPCSSPCPACVGFVSTVLGICMKAFGYESKAARHLMSEEFLGPFLSSLLLQSLWFSISLKIWFEGQLVRMQLSSLKCSNYLNIHQEWKQRQSELPLVKCYNMGRSEK